MKSFRVEIAQEEKPQRIDSFLSSLPDIPSRAFAQKLLKNKSVLVGGKKVSKSFNVKEGDIVEFTLPDPEQIEVDPEDIPLAIYYQDEDLAVVEKPAGLVTHPSYGHWQGTLVNALLFHLKDLSGIGGVLRPGIIHRLDKDTSGLLIVAKNDKSHLELSRQLKDRKIKRRYIALVHGHLTESEGKIEMPLGRSYKDRKKMAVIPDGRQAITSYKLQEEFSGYDLLEVTLSTGRTHQIRVHMASIGHPVVGDDVYGSKDERKSIPLNRYFLHAFELSFTHPQSGQEMYFLSPLPEELQAILDDLKNKTLR